MNFTTLYNKNRNLDIINILIIVLFLTICFILFFGKLGNPIFDCGREAYIPSEILKGQVLYKHILNLYGPLSYQINALLYKFFGEKLQVIYFAGYINTIIILISIYLISKIFVSRFLALSLSLFIMVFCAFNLSLFNYIFPYSYAAIYSFSSFLISLLLLLTYIKTNNKKLIPFAYLFCGISILNKIDFTLFLFLLMSITFYFKPVCRKYLAISLISFIIPFILSWGSLFLSGLTLSDILEYIRFMNKYIHARTLKYFFSYHLLSFSFKAIKIDLMTFILTVLRLYLLSLPIYTLIKLVKNRTLKIKKNRYLILESILKIIIVLAVIKCIPGMDFFYGYDFSSINVIVLIILLIILREFFLKNYNNLEKKLLITLIIATILVTLKNPYFVNFSLYGFIFGPLLIVITFTFITSYFQQYFKSLDKDILTITISILLIIISVTRLTSLYTVVLNNVNYSTSTNKGLFYTDKSTGKVVYDLLYFIKNNTNSNEKILILPEELMVNFLANRRSINKFYSLVPNNIETYGNDYIVNELAKNKPDYIALNNINCSDYGVTYKKIYLSQKIKEFIFHNYTLTKTFGSSFIIQIYKKNKVNQ